MSAWVAAALVLLCILAAYWRGRRDVGEAYWDGVRSGADLMLEEIELQQNYTYLHQQRLFEPDQHLAILHTVDAMAAGAKGRHTEIINMTKGIGE